MCEWGVIRETRKLIFTYNVVATDTPGGTVQVDNWKSHKSKWEEMIFYMKQRRVIIIIVIIPFKDFKADESNYKYYLLLINLNQIKNYNHLC